MTNTPEIFQKYVTLIQKLQNLNQSHSINRF